MNERIGELYEQSFVTDSYVNVSPNGAELGIRFDPEKFAELIVRECAGIYDKIDNGNQHMGTDNYLEALQKHFGVER